MRLLIGILLAGSLAAQTKQHVVTIIPDSTRSNVGILEFLDKQSTSHKITFQAPDTLAADLPYTLWSVDAAGPICSDGAGTLSIGTCGGSGGLPVPDTTNIVFNASDHTKLMRFDASLIGTGQTRVLQIQNHNYILAGTNIIQQWTASQTFEFSNAGGGLVHFQNNDTTGFGGIEYFDHTGTYHGVFGWANAFNATSPNTLVIGTGQSADGMVFAPGATVPMIEILSSGNLQPVSAQSGLLPLGSVGHRWGTFTGSGISVNGSSFVLAGGTLNLQLGSTLNVNTDYALGSDNAYDIGATARRVKKLWVYDLDIAGICTGCGSAGLPVIDTTAIVKGSIDPTKLMRFDVGGFSTGVTRVLTPPNQNFHIAGTDVLQTFSVYQNIAFSNNNGGLFGFQNNDTRGFSGFDMYDSSLIYQGVVGWANASASIPSTLLVDAAQGSGTITLATSGIGRAIVSNVGILPFSSTTYGLGDVTHKWNTVYVSSLEAYGSSHFNLGSTLNIQNGASFSSNPGSSFTVQSDTMLYTMNATIGPQFTMNNNDATSGNTGIHWTKGGTNWYAMGTDGSAVGLHEWLLFDYLNNKTTIHINAAGDLDLQPNGGNTFAGSLLPYASSTYTLGDVTHKWLSFFVGSLNTYGSSFITNGATLTFQAGSTLNVGATYNLTLDNTYDIGSFASKPATVYTHNLNVSGICTGCSSGGGVTSISVLTPLGQSSSTGAVTLSCPFCFTTNTNNTASGNNTFNGQTTFANTLRSSVDLGVNIGATGARFATLFVGSVAMTGGGYFAFGTPGISTTSTVGNGFGGTCTLVYTSGLRTGGTC